ncbi:putative protein tag-76, partial [Trichinella spiralis]|uniref:putative protein tag-76 n=1 Tax=Trichinella spiralis TaxID=6334 RepID=UPI0001EFEA26
MFVKRLNLACNLFSADQNTRKGDIVLNRYHIDIQHPRLKLNWFDDDNREIFWAYVVKRSDIFGDPFKLAYDGKSTLFTVDKLHLKPVSEKADTEKFSFKTVRENEPSEFSILMKFTGLVHLDFRQCGSRFAGRALKRVQFNFWYYWFATTIVHLHYSSKLQ